MTLYLVLCLHGGGYPQFILARAAKLNDDNETIKNNFFAVYSMILAYWFPFSEGYLLYPKWAIPDCKDNNNDNNKDTEDPSIDFVIEHHDLPFLLVDIQPPSDFQSDSGRHIAISQVIAHLDKIGPTNLHADQLYAISAFGKRWRACYASKGRGGKDGQPVKGIAAEDSLLSFSPECWNLDITSDESWVALQSIVEKIKGYVA